MKTPSEPEGSDVSFQEVDRHDIKEFKLYFNLLINSFNNNDLSRKSDYMGRLTALLQKLEGYKKVPPNLKLMMEKVRYIQHHIEKIQGMEEIHPEIKKIQEALDKMG